MTIFDPILDRIINHFVSGDYQNEVKNAKISYFENLGIPDESSEEFEIRMAQFLDWYIFTRELDKIGLSPVQYAAQGTEINFTDEELIMVDNLTNVIHGIFQFLKIKKSDIYIKGLFTGKKHVLKDSNVSAGFNIEELFEARLIPNGESWTFTRGFCFHPKEAKRFILKEIKKIKHLGIDEKEALITRLSRMKYKFEQYRHIKMEYIYTNDSKLRL